MQSLSINWDRSTENEAGIHETWILMGLNTESGEDANAICYEDMVLKGVKPSEAVISAAGIF